MSRKTKAAEFIDAVYPISVTGRNILVTDAMKAYAIDKISKIERFSNRIIEVVVTMDVAKLEHRVDIVVKVDHVKIKSHAASEDMYTSIDKAVHKLETQLLRYKDKLQDHQARGVAEVDMNVNILRSADEENLVEVNAEIEEENKKRLMDKYHPHRIVSKEKRLLKTLTDGEALMKMDLSGDAFIIYRSEESRLLKVMYRRNDGNFGVIEPEF